MARAVAISLLLSLCALLLRSPTLAAEEQVVEDYWVLGRSSWYGNQEGNFVGAFAPYRGGGRSAFGVIPWGGCGYTNGDGTVVWPRDQISSYADQNPDFPGSCGRCYEVKCHDGDVIGWNDQPVDYKNNYFAFWDYVSSVPDDMGRSFPGNAGKNNATPTVNVKCWQPKQSVVVRIIDICPCHYQPQGQQMYIQGDCCYKSVNTPKAGQWNFDMSYWAFEKLAHPMYGIMMIDFRPVDCTTHQPIRLQPGYISTSLYTELPGVGWAWFPTGQINNNFAVVAKGQGRNGGNAACAQMRPKEGGMTWLCRKCGDPGYQPFSGARAIQFYIRDKDHPGQVPNVILNVGNPDKGIWCNNKPWLRSLTPVAQEGDWLKFYVDVSALGCSDIATASQVAFDPQETANFCVDDFSIITGAGVAAAAQAPAGAQAPAAQLPTPMATEPATQLG